MSSLKESNVLALSNITAKHQPKDHLSEPQQSKESHSPTKRFSAWIKFPKSSPEKIRASPQINSNDSNLQLPDSKRLKDLETNTLCIKASKDRKF